LEGLGERDLRVAVFEDKGLEFKWRPEKKKKSCKRKPKKLSEHCGRSLRGRMRGTSQKMVI